MPYTHFTPEMAASDFRKAQAPILESAHIYDNNPTAFLYEMCIEKCMKMQCEIFCDTLVFKNLYCTHDIKALFSAIESAKPGYIKEHMWLAKYAEALSELNNARYEEGPKGVIIDEDTIDSLHNLAKRILQESTALFEKTQQRKFGSLKLEKVAAESKKVFKLRENPIFGAEEMPDSVRKQDAKKDTSPEMKHKEKTDSQQEAKAELPQKTKEAYNDMAHSIRKQAKQKSHHNKSKGKNKDKGRRENHKKRSKSYCDDE